MLLTAHSPASAHIFPTVPLSEFPQSTSLTSLLSRSHCFQEAFPDAHSPEAVPPVCNQSFLCTYLSTYLSHWFALAYLLVSFPLWTILFAKTLFYLCPCQKVRVLQILPECKSIKQSWKWYHTWQRSPSTFIWESFLCVLTWLSDSCSLLGALPQLPLEVTIPTYLQTSSDCPMINCWIIRHMYKKQPHAPP